MDQSTESTPSQQPSSSDKIGYPKTAKSGKKKVLFGLAGFLSVFLVAGATYSVLTVTIGQKASIDTKLAPVEKVETPGTIDADVQSIVEDEQDYEEESSDAQSQSVIDDVNSTKDLEGEYADS